MTKRRIRALREEWKRTHGGEAPADTRGTWGLKRFWVRIGARKSQRDLGVRIEFSRSRRRRMKKQHLYPRPEGRKLERLGAAAARAFRPKRHKRESNASARARARPRVGP